MVHMKKSSTIAIQTNTSKDNIVLKNWQDYRAATPNEANTKIIYGQDKANSDFGSRLTSLGASSLYSGS